MLTVNVKDLIYISFNLANVVEATMGPRSSAHLARL